MDNNTFYAEITRLAKLASIADFEDEVDYLQGNIGWVMDARQVGSQEWIVGNDSGQQFTVRIESGRITF